MLMTRHLTTHSTGARIELLSSARLESIGGWSRPVNSVVRRLLLAIIEWRKVNCSTALIWKIAGCVAGILMGCVAKIN